LAAIDFTLGFAGERLSHARKEEVFKPFHSGAARWPPDEEQVILVYGTLN
jgi:hypothetical protein